MIPLLAAILAVGPLASYRGHDRVLLAFAPTVVDAALVEQRENTDVAAFAARDLRQVEVIGDSVRGATDSAAALRARFGIPPAAFRAVLLGKDGNVALTATAPVTSARIVAAIDAMPMRQDEVRRGAPR